MVVTLVTLPTFMDVFLAPIAYFLFGGLDRVIRTMRGEPNTKGKYSAFVQMLTHEIIHYRDGS